MRYNESGKEKHSGRYKNENTIKFDGVTYTPKRLADFVAQQIFKAFSDLDEKQSFRILDPAVGDGELLDSLLSILTVHIHCPIEVVGYDIDNEALTKTQDRLSKKYPEVTIHLKNEDFIEYIITNFDVKSQQLSLWDNQKDTDEPFDVVISNPPYVRTQIIGADRAKIISEKFGLSGRIDLYHAFILGISQVLSEKGIAGIIVSNRFMTTKTGISLRKEIVSRFSLLHVWDMGDTKIFDVAVLPAVLLVGGIQINDVGNPHFTTVYQLNNHTIEGIRCDDFFKHIDQDCVVTIPNGQTYKIQQGYLNVKNSSDVNWRISTKSKEEYLGIVDQNKWGVFQDIGKIRVGIKSCADKVMIRDDWGSITNRPELLFPLTTHHDADRFRTKTDTPKFQVLYPYDITDSKRHPVNLQNYPNTLQYLQENRALLESRKYLIDAGREWFELWVPQNPDSWKLPKLIFRDISEKPTFWIDINKTIVNGDCYWLISDNNSEELLWLACAVANSTFIEWYYDSVVNNKLYAGRRRFMTQYVNLFPLPNPLSSMGKEITALAHEIYNAKRISNTDKLEMHLDTMIWQSFGLSKEEVLR